MRLVLLANRDIHACLALNLLGDALAAHDATIFLSSGVGGRAPALPELAFLRELEQSIPVHRLFPELERGDTIPGDLRTFGQLARAHGAGGDVLDDPNGPEGLAALRACAPDVIVSIRYGRILRGDAIAIPRFGVLNLHSGVLPDYRGVLSTFRAMMAGDDHVGCTLHRIVDGGIDSGPLVGVARIPREAQSSYFDGVQSVYPAGTALIREALASIASGRAPVAHPPAHAGSYFTFPTASEFADFRRRGYRLFDSVGYEHLLRRFLPLSSG